IATTNEDLEKHTTKGAKNMVYIVSDGVETCDGDPVVEAEKLNNSNTDSIVHIIGFDVDDDGQKALKEIVETGEGKYITATSQEEITTFFNEEVEELKKAWLQWRASNVSEYYGTEREKRNRVHELKNEIQTKANNEKEKLDRFVVYM